MSKYKLSVKLNVKRVAPVLNFGSAAALSTAALTAMNRSQNTPVLSRALQEESRSAEADDQPVAPAVKWDGKQSLGQLWSDHLLTSSDYISWSENGTEFLKRNGDYDIQSTLFKNAHKRAKRNKDVQGKALERACKKVYEMKRKPNKKETSRLSDVWKYCRRLVKRRISK